MSKQTLILDTEVYIDYFLASFMNTETGNVREFEMFHGHPFDAETVKRIMARYKIVTFNGNSFDIPVMSEAVRGAGTAALKNVANDIIVRGKRHWELGIEPMKCDHIDLIEVAPGMASLKIYGGRLHCDKLQDLPIEPDAHISPSERIQLKTYCVNDLRTTKALYDKLLPQIELRERMSAEYGVDLRSKSDAQIAEAVIGKQVAHAMGVERLYRPILEPDSVFTYTPPAFIQFGSEPLQEVLRNVCETTFVVPESGKVDMPKSLSNARIQIGEGVYRMGIGGLHSSEKSVAYMADSDYLLIDRDVASYYPAIILNTGLAPEQMGGAFTQVYERIVKRRLEAKRKKDAVTADALKITINGSFGKFGSKWSKLYSPNLMIQTTVTGQLCLLMLIEQIEGMGIQVVSANTDGIVIKCPVGRYEDLLGAIREWEAATGFETEETRYRAIYSRDVNNYIAVKADGVKTKGAYATGGLMKNPTNEICSLAVVRMLTDFIPVEQTIRECLDIRKFVTIRQVKGGAVDQNGDYLGKAVRWYYATGVEGPLTYKTNGYTVARSEGARPLMDLPEHFPSDVDYDWYIREANSILADIGADKALGPLMELV